MARIFAALLVLGTIALAQPKAPEKDPLKEGEGEIPPGAVATVNGVPIAKDVFIHHISSRFAREGSDAEDVLASLVDEAIVRSHLRKRGLSVSEEDLQKKFNSLDRIMRGRTGKGLKETIAQQGLDMTAFKQKLRNVVGLEKLVPADLKLPEGKPVEDIHLKAWLTEKRSLAKIEKDSTKLPSHAILKVDDELVERSEFVASLLEMPGLAKPIRKEMEILIQSTLLERVLADLKVKVEKEDLDREWLLRKKRFEDDPKHRGLVYEAMIKQRTGWDAEHWRNSRAFRLHAAVSAIGRQHFDEAALREAFEKHRDFFGPELTLAHILIRASDGKKKELPSYEEAKKTADRILEKLRKGRRFADLARLYSEDPTTRFKGGKLNPFTPGRAGRLPKDLVNTGLKMKPGDVHDQLIRSRWGWHALQLIARKELPSYESVKDRLRRLLAEDLFRARLDAAKVVIDARR